MNVSPSCPRCGGSVSAPGPSSTAWHCNLHGAVFPLRTAYSPDGDGLRDLVRDAAVPVWLLWPLPIGWLVTGFAGAGDGHSGCHACVGALSGPNPAGGPRAMLLHSEEPGGGRGTWCSFPEGGGWGWGGGSRE